MRRGISIAIAAVTMAAAPARAAVDASVATHVLIVAHNGSLDKGVKPLRFADDDGARYWELFKQMTPHVTLLSVIDPDTARTHPAAARAARIPWARNVRKAVKRIAAKVAADNRAGRKTRFFFVYVGHGNVGSDGEGYVNLQDMRLRRSDLFPQIVDRIPASAIHLIIDACKSYFLVSRGPGDWRDDRSGRSYGDEVRAFLMRTTLDGRPHVGAILSTSGDEEVHEWSASRSGVFSHQLRSALSGAADLNADGKIEYSEAAAFIAAANRRVKHQRARIRPFVRPPAADRHVGIVQLPRDRRGPVLELGVQQRGRYTIEDDRGVRFADFNKASGVSLRLALSADHRYYVRRGDVEFVFPKRRRGVLSLAGLERIALRSRPRGALASSYRTGLFAVPYSRSFYEGYVAHTDLPSVGFDGEPAAWDDVDEPRRVQLELGYALSGPSLGSLDGLQHNVAFGVNIDIVGPLYVAARAELGVSRHSIPGEAFSMYRIGALVGAGLRFRLARWLEAGVQADVGYQALVLTRDARDPSSAKFGGAALATFFPWRSLPRFGINVRGGVYGHVVSVVLDSPGDPEANQVHASPEVGVGLSYGF